jgi:oxygen-dependent protoporphyrinogen oxidase
MTSEMRDVVVIGAGISGLVCAYRLKSLGADVLLIEQSDRVGGVIQSNEIDGYLVERGPNSTQGTEELLALVDELGISNELLEGDPKAPAYVYFGGRLHAVPSGPGAFIKSRLLSPGGKLRILAEPFVPQRTLDTEESVAEFARRRIGHEAADRMVAPFVSGIYAGDAASLSVQAAFPRLSNLEARYGGLIRGTIAKAREARREKKSAGAVLDKAAPVRKRLCSFKKGMGFLPAVLARRLGEDLWTECAAPTIGKGPIAEADRASKVFDIVFTRAGVQQRVPARRVVVASPARSAARLIEPLSSELCLLLDEIDYPPLAVLSLSYDRSTIATPIDGFGFLAAPSEGLKVLGCVWNSSLFPGRAPEGKALLTVFLGGARNPELTRLSDTELVSTAQLELQRVLKIHSGPRVVALTRYERAIPQYNLGHAARVARIETLLADLPGVSLVGNYLHGVSTGDCIKEADRIARLVHDSFSTTDEGIHMRSLEAGT